MEPLFRKSRQDCCCNAHTLVRPKRSSDCSAAAGTWTSGGKLDGVGDHRSHDLLISRYSLQARRFVSNPPRILLLAPGLGTTPAAYQDARMNQRMNVKVLPLRTRCIQTSRSGVALNMTARALRIVRMMLLLIPRLTCTLVGVWPGSGLQASSPRKCALIILVRQMNSFGL